MKGGETGLTQTPPCPEREYGACWGEALMFPRQRPGRNFQLFILFRLVKSLTQYATAFENMVILMIKTLWRAGRSVTQNQPRHPA